MRAKTNLDALRAFAVLTVFIDHATLFAGVDTFHGWDLRWLGDFGVYIFFVHTCLVLMWSLERRPSTLDFYIRRIFRIYPLAIITILIIAGFRIKAMYDPIPLTKGLIASNLLLVQNLWKHGNVVGVLWSLPLELQMYLLLPVFFAFARRERSVWSLVLIWAFACALNVATYGWHAGNGLYMVVPHFLPGVMAYIGFKRRRATLPSWALGFSVALLLVFFMWKPRAEMGWLVCLALGLTLPYFRDTQAKIVTIVSHRVATYSYGIYLLHPLGLWIGFDLLDGQPLWLRLGTSLLVLGVSAVSAYHLIERPLIQAGSHFAERLTRTVEPMMTERDVAFEVAP